MFLDSDESSRVNCLIYAVSTLIREKGRRAAPVIQAVCCIMEMTPQTGSNYSSMTDPDVE